MSARDMGIDPKDGSHHGAGDAGLDSAQQDALRAHAEALGTTADELAAALEQLALHAELVLHRLRGEPTH